RSLPEVIVLGGEAEIPVPEILQFGRPSGCRRQSILLAIRSNVSSFCRRGRLTLEAVPERRIMHLIIATPEGIPTRVIASHLTPYDWVLLWKCDGARTPVSEARTVTPGCHPGCKA